MAAGWRPGRWAYWGAWLLLGLFMFSQDAVSWDKPLQRRELALLVLLNVGQNLVWGALSLGTLWTCRRFPLHRTPPGHHWLGHVAASLVIVPAGLLLSAGMAFAAFPPSTAMREATLNFLAWYAPYQYLVCYWGVVGVHQGIRLIAAHEREEVQVSSLEAQLAEAQLRALRIQLNPHFLFNALNGLAGILHRDPALADRVLTKLSHFLRTSLEQSREEQVPLGRELELLEAYLEIERLRFGDGECPSVISVEVPRNLHDLLVPAFLLQPLVENAIKHGSPIRGRPLSIWIRAWEQPQGLFLEVLNDGQVRVGEQRPGTGFGLRSTRLRLQTLYGTQHEFLFEHRPEGGARVRIRVPSQRLSIGSSRTGDPSVALAAPACT